MTRHEGIRVAVFADESAIESWRQVPSVETRGFPADEDLEAAPGLAFDVIVIDHDRPWSHLIPRLRSMGVSAPVIIWSRTDEPAEVAAAMDAGAAGVLDPRAPMDELERALQIVMAGGSYLPPLDRLIVLDGLHASKPPESFESPPLSARETEVLSMLAQGLSARQISSRLSLSERTVNTHVANVYRKLGVSNRVEAVMRAMRMGIVSPRE